MDGLHEIGGGGRPVRIAGTTYRLAPLRVQDYAEMERHLLSTRPDPLDLVVSKLPGLPESQQRYLLELAYEDARRGRWISAEELDTWLAAGEGQVYRFWLSLRQQHPEIGLDEAEMLLRGAAGEESPGGSAAVDETAPRTDATPAAAKHPPKRAVARAGGSVGNARGRSRRKDTVVAE